MQQNEEHRRTKDLIENLLFLSPEPLSIEKLASSLPCSKEEIAAAIDSLRADYETRGIRLRHTKGGWQFTSDPALADDIERFWNQHRRKRLSKAAIETLAVIAYLQPVTRAQIEAVRGVQSIGTIQTLQEANLVKVVGQRDSVGNPYLYGTTDEFLSYFGLSDKSELPPLEFGDAGLHDAEKQAEVKAVDFAPRPASEEISAHVKTKGA